MTYIAIILLVVKLAASGGTRNTNGGSGTRAIGVALLIVYRRTKLAGSCEINGGRPHGWEGRKENLWRNDDNAPWGAQ